MQFKVSQAPLSRAEVEVLAVGTYQTDDGPELAPGGEALAEALGWDPAARAADAGHDGSVGSVVRLPTGGAVPARSVAVVGLGRRDTVSTDVLRRAAAVLARTVARHTSLATTLPAAGVGLPAVDAARAVAEGIGLGTYRFDAYRSEPQPVALDEVRLHAAGDVPAGALRRAVADLPTVLDAVRLARDIVNEPAAAKRPPELAERVRSLLRGTGVRVRVLDEEALRRGGYGGLLGVGAGSAAPPRLVELVWAPPRARRHVALVGKGITFDSGGLSLKPANSMVTMKMDMAGAATVLAVVRAAAQLALPVRLTGVMCLAENMPSGTATRPGDVLTIRGGRTVEVLNTDAEGRLVLADGLVHAAEKGPDVVVDIATLTGAIVVALGPRIGGLFSEHDELADALLDAARATGERLWRMPLARDLYGKDLKGDVADIRNAGWRDAGPVRAALFLREFVPDDLPWAHLDIAGLAWSEEEDGELTKGATGAPVRTLIEWLRRR